MNNRPLPYKPPTWVVDKPFGCDCAKFSAMNETNRIMTPLLAVDAVILFAGRDCAHQER